MSELSIFNREDAPTQPQEPPVRPPPPAQPVRVQITDIDMPFWSMVMFMVKAGLASIPAFFLVMTILTFFWMALKAIFVH